MIAPARRPEEVVPLLVLGKEQQRTKIDDDASMRIVVLSDTHCRHRSISIPPDLDVLVVRLESKMGDRSTDIAESL